MSYRGVTVIKAITTEVWAQNFGQFSEICYNLEAAEKSLTLF
jgi:hypothetical protein